MKRNSSWELGWCLGSYSAPCDGGKWIEISAAAPAVTHTAEITASSHQLRFVEKPPLSHGKFPTCLPLSDLSGGERERSRMRAGERGAAGASRSATSSPRGQLFAPPTTAPPSQPFIHLPAPPPLYPCCSHRNICR